MPFRARFRYDRVYDKNVDRIGSLGEPLPELIALYYTRTSALLEDMLNLGEGVYASLDSPIIVRIYQDLATVMRANQELAARIVDEIDRAHPPSPGT